MSLHVVNPELEAQLAAQRRNSTIASIIIGILLMALLGTIFYLIAINIFTKETKAIVAYSEEALEEENVEKVKVNNSVQKTPSAPSSSAVQVITAQTTSDFAVPTPEVFVDTLTVEFGSSDGFGDGFGGGFGGFGKGGGGSFSFMGSKMSGDRVCFVMDYSLSMQGKRISLLKSELEKTIESLPNKLQYQMIFFAGPAWIAGSNVSARKGGGTVSLDGKSYSWKGRGPFEWSQSGTKQPVEWLVQSEEVKEESLNAIRSTPLVWGTSWTSPLEMAMNISPKPELIVFLTDGSSGNDSFAKAKRLGNAAKSKGIKVNTIALMEPNARAAMAELAKLTNGEFSMIDQNGNKVKQKN